MLVRTNMILTARY